MYFFQFLAHNAVVTCSVFSPNPAKILEQLDRNTEEKNSENDDASSSSQFDTLKSAKSTVSASAATANPSSSATASASGTLKSLSSAKKSSTDSRSGYVIVSGDFDGDIKVFYTLSKPKHSSLPSSAMA